MWIVSKAFSWSSLDMGILSFQTPPIGSGQPQKFIPVFMEKADAIEFAGEEDKHLIMEICAIDR